MGLWTTFANLYDVLRVLPVTLTTPIQPPFPKSKILAELLSSVLRTLEVEAAACRDQVAVSGPIIPDVEMRLRIVGPKWEEAEGIASGLYTTSESIKWRLGIPRELHMYLSRFIANARDWAKACCSNQTPPWSVSSDAWQLAVCNMLVNHGAQDALEYLDEIWDHCWVPHADDVAAMRFRLLLFSTLPYQRESDFRRLFETNPETQPVDPLALADVCYRESRSIDTRIEKARKASDMTEWLRALHVLWPKVSNQTRLLAWLARVGSEEVSRNAESRYRYYEEMRADLRVCLLSPLLVVPQMLVLGVKNAKDLRSLRRELRLLTRGRLFFPFALEEPVMKALGSSGFPICRNTHATFAVLMQLFASQLSPGFSSAYESIYGQGVPVLMELALMDHEARPEFACLGAVGKSVVADMLEGYCMLVSTPMHNLPMDVARVFDGGAVMLSPRGDSYRALLVDRCTPTVSNTAAAEPVDLSTIVEDLLDVLRALAYTRSLGLRQSSEMQMVEYLLEADGARLRLMVEGGVYAAIACLGASEATQARYETLVKTIATRLFQ